MGGSLAASVGRTSINVRTSRVTCALIAVSLAIMPVAAAQETSSDEPPTVRMARATWDTGWFQAEVYRLLIQRLGFRVEGPTTMENAEFYEAVAAGETDLWVNGWFPLHDSHVSDVETVERVGVQVDDGALQGYFVDAATAGEHGITNLGDLADRDIAGLFDRNGDGRAELIGCNLEWACAATVDHHLAEYGLEGRVEHVQGDYSPLMTETIELQANGQPVLFYTFTPNWTVGELVPGEDVVWLETPYPSLPPDQAQAEDRTTIADIPGCAADPCQTGWPPNDIQVVANTSFLEDHPTLRTLFEQVTLPLDDILDQNARMVDGEGDIADIRRHAAEWVAANEGTVAEWVQAADPDAVPYREAGTEGDTGRGALRVAARALPPFVIYEDRTYQGFEVELTQLLATQLGMEPEIYAVDTVAKQIDDVSRGAADVAVGGVGITRDREELIDFSLPVLDTGLTVLVPTRTDSGVFGQIGSFVRTLIGSDLPWLVVVFAIATLIAAHLIWWLERRHNPDFAEPYGRGLWDSLYWSVVTMSTVGYGDKVARGNVGRVFALIWIATGTLVFASFTAAIASALAVDELRRDIGGPTDLPGHRVATVTGSAGQEYLTSQGISPVLVDQVEAAYALVEDDEVDAIVFDAPVLDFHASRRGQGTVETVGPTFEDVTYGIVVSQDEAALREEINRALLELIESGVYEQLRNQWFGSGS